jgi:hypothetical protein
LIALHVLAMCGCFVQPQPKVGVAVAKITNKASQVVMVHDGDRTVVTMSNDFQGDPSEFAIVIPVPTAITREQIHVGERDMLDKLATATAPQVLEYPANDPCNMSIASARGGMKMDATAPSGEGGGGGRAAKTLGVTVDASYTVGEYDIQMLSATDAEGLSTWLKTNGYAAPDGATRVFETYLRQNMRFFVAKVNVGERAKTGSQFLRPIQIAYESPKFVLPIRLGMLNADGAQELTVYTVTRKGRVESTNYRTVKVSRGVGGMLPQYVAGSFDRVYRAAFLTAEKREGMNVLFEEYAAPLYGQTANFGVADLRQLGMWWSEGGMSEPVFVTRLHFLYDEKHFPEDLVLQTTTDQVPYQTQFSVQDTVREPSCMQGEQLRQWQQSLRATDDAQARELARLTGWDESDIRREMAGGKVRHHDSDLPSSTTPPATKRWYDNLWK